MSITSNEIRLNINIMLKQTEQASYFQKYQRWADLLSKTKSQDSQAYTQTLQVFLEYFPFNYNQWQEFINQTNPQNYQIALKRNPKSYELWMSYLSYIRTTPIKEDAAKYKKQIEKAILEIGADCRTGSLYLQYYGMISENYRYEFFKKIFTRALLNLEQIYELFEKWFSSQSLEQLQGIAAKETKGRQQIQPDELSFFLTNQLKQTYEKTLLYRKNRQHLENQIRIFYFNSSQKIIEEDYKIWRNLIALERANGIVENISYCYERMLMAQMHDISLWEEVFHYLENQTNKYTKVLNIFRYNRAFFTKFNNEIYFYWCELEERENPNEARKMYVEIEKYNSGVAVILRHIQFQIREKQWENAKNLFDTLIVQNQEKPENVDLLCYILIEYTNYVTKYYKDFEYPKTLLQSYFEYLPYNHYLFINYLNFMRNFEYKEGYYDELMTLIVEGLKKARNSVSVSKEQFEKKVVKMIKHHLRTVLSSIYLIRLSERKMMVELQNMS